MGLASASSSLLEDDLYIPVRRMNILGLLASKRML